MMTRLFCTCFPCTEVSGGFNYEGVGGLKTVYWLILLWSFLSPVHPLIGSGAQGCDRGWRIEAIIPFMTCHAPVEHV